ncbi:hypothetical protein CTheo_7234 [Ceratobasidium theobromae]|uniref:Pectate lyase domain-containing protein n=1 Tax=Ceratobasidium theobromae TaxID=1582974 RepID=A0A5N5QDC2_9AGAM|nr:hypothetical protein CTheo_7234 [Ceratobasidium theobromae]
MRVVAISISLLAALAQFVSAARMQQSSHDPDDILIPEEKASTNIANERASIGYAALGGTTGGIGGNTVTVSTLEQLTSEVATDVAKIIIISGTITGNAVVRIGSNKSILGKSGASLVGVGLRVLKKSNVIIRNLKINKVLATAGDALAVQQSSKVWIDHVDLSSDRNHGKDHYDGLIDITHGSTYVSVTNSLLHNHYKASLVGHSDGNAVQDKAITVTYAMNKWENLNSRMPSFRAGVGHIYNNYFVNSGDGINTRVGGQVLVENNVWRGVKKALYSTEGFAVARGNDFGGASHTAPEGRFSQPPYKYTLLDAAQVMAAVQSSGATLSFGAAAEGGKGGGSSGAIVPSDPAVGPPGGGKGEAPVGTTPPPDVGAGSQNNGQGGEFSGARIPSYTDFNLPSRRPPMRDNQERQPNLSPAINRHIQRRRRASSF